MKYKIGEKVKIKSGLVIGSLYHNEDELTCDVFVSSMIKYVGIVCTIINIERNKYHLDIGEEYFSYTCSMLESENDINQECNEKSEYIYNEEVEELVEHMLRLIPSQLINDALDNGNENRFKELSEFYANGIRQNSR